MSINSLMNNALSGLVAQNLAIDVTGENITNVNTDGYSKQTAQMVTGITAPELGFPLGSGVKVAAIQRSYDSFLQSQMMDANSTAGNATTNLGALQTVQSQFTDLNSDGLGKSLQTFFNAFQDLSANPQGVSEREAVLSDAQQLVDNIHMVNSSLNDVKSSTNQSLQQITSNINDDLSQIATLNVTILRTEVGGNNANELRDQREKLMRDLSQKVGVKFTDNSDGTVSITSTSGQSLVSKDHAASFSLKTNAATGYYDVILSPADASAPVNVTSTIGGYNNSEGNIGAALQIRDVAVDKYLGKLDELAATVADQVNAVQTAGYGLTTASHGINFFTPTGGITTGYSASIQLNLTSTDDIAASDTDPAVGGTGNNNNAKTLANLYNKSLSMSTGTSTMGDFYNTIVAGVGVDVQSAQRTQTQNKYVMDQLNNQRESQAGVSLDEELVNLTKYQKAYQGAAKVINVGTEMFDTVLSLIQ